MAELASTSLFNDANLVSYWKLEDTADSKGSNTLTNNGSATFASGKFNNAVNLVPGSSQFLNNTGALIAGLGDKSISCWVNVTNQPSNATFIPVSFGNASHRFFLEYVDASGTKTIKFGNGSVNTTLATQTLTTGVWYNLILNYASDVFTLYINGVIQPTQTDATHATNSTGFNIGRQGPLDSTNFWDGLIDDVALFSRVLTQADAITIFNDGHILSTSKYW